MTLPVIANVMRCSIFGTVEGGVSWSNTLHIRKAAGSSYLAAGIAATTEIAKLYGAHLYGAGKLGWADMATDGSFAKQIVITPLDGVTPSAATSISVAGVSTQAPLPAQNAIVTTFQSAVRGRSHRGRTFWAGTSREIMTAGGVIDPSDITGIQLAWSAWATAVAGAADLESHCVASYLLGTSDDVVSYIPRPVHGHQTKRRGRGA